MKPFPTTDMEGMFHHKGIEYVAGVDEAGRGPVAGPVTVAAVIFRIPARRSIPEVLLQRVRDSKQIAEKDRAPIAESIKQHAVDFSVVHVTNETIDSLNILNATRLAVLRAVESLRIKPQVVLIDGKFLNLKTFTCISIVKGDERIFSIAAASILAKASRDSLMLGYAQEFPCYSFEKNKGYLTPQHLQAIREHGYSPLHRRSFTIAL